MTEARNEPSLDGVRVLDLTAGAADGLRDALLGLRASVLAVEPLDGAESDGLPVVWPRPGDSSVLRLDLTCGPDRDTLLAVAREASVFVEAWRPGFADILGFGYDTLRVLNPRLLYLSLGSTTADGPTVAVSLGRAIPAAGGSASGAHLVLG